ncbi:hypothetical protein Tco_0015764 [Tanacetum coccineum]
MIRVLRSIGIVNNFLSREFGTILDKTVPIPLDLRSKTTKFKLGIEVDSKSVLSPTGMAIPLSLGMLINSGGLVSVLWIVLALDGHSVAIITLQYRVGCFHVMVIAPFTQREISGIHNVLDEVTALGIMLLAFGVPVGLCSCLGLLALAMVVLELLELSELRDLLVVPICFLRSLVIEYRLLEFCC